MLAEAVFWTITGNLFMSAMVSCISDLCDKTFVLLVLEGRVVVEFFSSLAKVVPKRELHLL